jgi:hypothetical protein
MTAGPAGGTVSPLPETVMTCHPVYPPPGICQAGHTCHRPARFQARLEAAPGPGQSGLRKDAEACASHLTDVIQGLTTWASDHHLTDGHVTVLAIDPLPYSAYPPGPARREPGTVTPGLIFSTIQLTP